MLEGSTYSLGGVYSTWSLKQVYFIALEKSTSVIWGTSSLNPEWFTVLYDPDPTLLIIPDRGVKFLPWRDYTVKKLKRFSRPQPGCHWLNSPWAGIFPPRESLVSDIPAGDGKIV